MNESYMLLAALNGELHLSEDDGASLLCGASFGRRAWRCVGFVPGLHMAPLACEDCRRLAPLHREV